MNERKDPDFSIIRAADGFLALKVIRDKSKQGKGQVIPPAPVAPAVQPVITPVKDAEDWQSITDKKQLDEYAAKQGIQLDRRKSLAEMQADLEKQLNAE